MSQQIKIKPDYLYRKGVGIMIINNLGEIFVGKRIDNKSDAWQMPQGGIDELEDEDIAMLRELKEETGIDKEKITLIKKSSEYYYYDLPYNLQKKFWGGKYLGQKQRWYLVKLNTDDSSININGQDPEFSDWRWVNKNELISRIVSFKKSLYEEILLEFTHLF